MKKFVLSAFAAMALSTVSSAAIITCTAANGNPNVIVNNVSESSPKTYNCAAYVAPGGTEVFQIALRLAASFNDEVQDNVNSTLTADGTASLGGATNSVTTLGGDFIGVTSPFQQQGAFFNIAPSGSLAASTVAITWSVTGPAVQNGTVTVSLVTNERQIVTSGVPEPSTFMMLGTALTGLGLFARRRKA
jgi:PEP-CTERM motif